MTTLSERVQKILDETPELDQPGLAKIAGVTKATVNQWLDGKIKSMKLEYAARIQKRLGFSAVWLVLDEGDERLGTADGGADVKSSITNQSGALSFSSAREQRARLLANTLLDVSTEMRDLMDELATVDREGGVTREMLIAGIGYLMKSLPGRTTEQKGEKNG